MVNNLSQYVKEQRQARNLNRAELAKLMGYSNVTKGMNRITALENGQDLHPEILEKIIKALNLDRKKVETLLQSEKQEYEKAFEEWADTPVPMKLIVRYMAAFYISRELPLQITTADQAEEYACNFAREHRLMACLALSRRQALWINREGEVYYRATATPYNFIIPFIKLKNSKQKFLFREKI